MNYQQFLKPSRRLEDILVMLGILKQEYIFIPINNRPDYDISEYQREVFTNYYFNNSWGFAQEFQSVVEAKIIESHILHADSINKMSQEYEVDYNGNDKFIPSFLSQVFNKDKEALSIYGFGTEAGEFKINNVRISSINNFECKINYDGSFIGNSSDIEPLDWGVYSLVRIVGIPADITESLFYKSLLAECYVLFKENKMKLAYFTAYSALESFINYQLGTGDEGGERLKDKLTELFNFKFSNLSTHQIYCSVASMFNPYTTDRNTIAHGRNAISLSKEQAKDALIFVSLLICTYEHNLLTFDELVTKFN